MRTCHCGRPSGNRTLCAAHRKRKQDGRDSDRPIRLYVRGIEARLMAHSTRQGKCLIWHGKMNRHGYGRMRVDGVDKGAHRVAYEHWVGPIPDGFHLDHLCHIRACIEPSHLEPVTPRENSRRALVERDTSTGRFTPTPIGKDPQFRSQRTDLQPADGQNQAAP